MKRIIQTLTAVVLLAALFVSSCAAAAGGDGGVNAVHAYADGASSFVLLAANRTNESMSAKRSAFIATVQARMLRRVETFTVHYDGPLEEVYTHFSNLLDEIYAYDAADNSGAGDYLEYNCKALALDISYSSDDCDFTFHITYRTTAVQEQYVDNKVTAILNAMRVSGADDYTKIKTVYDYVCTHFCYDDTYSNFTAYDGLTTGKMVCQGYALLVYKMLSELNVPVRIIPGTTEGGGHVWNIVCLGGAWYNLDATWDAAESTKTAVSHQYFLKNQADFKDHQRESTYAAASFLNAYPMASQSFLLSEPVGCVALSGADAVIMGGKITLTAIVYPKAAGDAALAWTSSDESVARVDENGTVTAVSAGTAVITAAAADGEAFARHSVTVADFSGASAWHREELTALYQTGVIPAGLLGNYTAPMTRAEFVALLVRVCEPELGEQTAGTTPFRDIGGHLYEREISVGYDLGIVKGKSADRFAPNDPLTRQEAAKLLCGALHVLKGVDAAAEADLADADYTDAGAIGSWALPFVAYTTDNGILHGNGGRFYPAQSLTREQGMAVVRRIIVRFNLQAAA